MSEAIIPIPGFSEPFSSMSHLFATGPFAVWAVWLLLRSARWRGAGVRAIWLGLFIWGTLFLLSMSGVYHLLEPGGTARAVLQRLDHAAIFVLIASTFTAAHGILFQGIWRWGMILLIWVLAATAITLKTVFFRDISTQLGLVLYLGLGWLGAISGIKLARTYGFAMIRWLLAGAIAYSLGAVAEFLGQPVLIHGVVGPHEMFHVAVLLGLAAHWYFVWQLAGGNLTLSATRAADFGDSVPMILSSAQIEERIRRAVPASASADFEFRIEHSSYKKVRIRLAFNERMLRLGGTISGPTQMTLTDTAMYALLLAASNLNGMALTTDVSFHFLARPAAGDLFADAEFLSLGNTLAVIAVRITDMRGVLVTQASGTYVLPRGKPA